jgi:GNAT superfamily N-acetyltransferase
VSAEFQIEEWRAGAAGEDDLEGLARVLYEAVHAGASVSFILPFSTAKARAFWREKVLPEVEAGRSRLFVARLSGRISGVVQLDLGTPPNQGHRAEVRKLLVEPAARRRGIARALMLALEEAARSERRTLLTLDTRTGDAAEPLYTSMGYVTAGIIPNFARGPLTPELEATTLMYKWLGSS